MQLGTELGIGIAALAIGLALVWFGMPNKVGEHPRFLRAGFMQMIYPAAALTFIAIGVASLLAASW
jgi:hypothetical protein